MDIAPILFGIAIGSLIAAIIYYFKSHLKRSTDLIDKIDKSLYQCAISELDLTKQRVTLQGQEITKLENQLSISQREYRDMLIQVSTLNAELTAERKVHSDKLDSQKRELEAMQSMAKLEFEKLASQILEDKSNRFTQTNKSNIESLLKPLAESIDSFRAKVESTATEETKQRSSLEAQVKALIEQTNKISDEANNLASALKGQAKKMGNWGELILESILEQSGLVKDREYFVQSSIKSDDTGRSLRPDVLVRLPENRTIIIDSKVSLVAYDHFYSADTKEQQDIYIAEHIRSMKAHIDSLASKKYDDIESALDFTMMFVPIEPAYILALQNNKELWSYAYEKRILLISPTNLIACLKIISDLWRREMQSKNALEIVKRGELMYEKFILFTNTLEEVGRSIGKSKESYDKALGQLNQGRGNLVSQAQQLKKLGLKSSKTIADTLLSDDQDLEMIEESPGRSITLE